MSRPTEDARSTRSCSSRSFSILKNMNTKQRRRAEILGELENIPFAVQGKICENRKTLANGKVAVYHNLQWWQDGKNHAIHIPEDRLVEFEEAVKGGKRAKELLMELSRCDAQAVLSEDSTSKKKSTRSASRAGRNSKR